MKRGEVYWANLSPRSGSEQSGKRPVVVVSHDAFVRAPGWHSIIVVPLSTSQVQAARGPTAIRVSKGAAGLERESTALCHQVTTLDRAKLVEHIGTLPKQLLSEIAAGLRVAMALE